MKMYSSIFAFLFISLHVLISLACALEDNSITESVTDSVITTEPPPVTTIITSTTTTMTTTTSTTEATILGCSCGIFLSGQFKKGSKEPPKGNPALLHEQPDTYPCTNAGNKFCTNKCLDTIVKHLPNSPNILCASMGRDCFREKAHLFIKNCKDEWINTNLSAGREYCCKDGLPYKCPLVS